MIADSGGDKESDLYLISGNWSLNMIDNLPSSNQNRTDLQWNSFSDWMKMMVIWLLMDLLFVDYDDTDDELEVLLITSIISLLHQFHAAFTLL